MFVSEDVFGTIVSLGGSVTDTATTVAGALVTVVGLVCLFKMIGTPAKAIASLLVVALGAAIFFDLGNVTKMVGKSIDNAGQSSKATSE